MEIRRVADTLLRCQASPFPHLPPTSSSTFSLSCKHHPTNSIRRTFTSSTRRCIKIPPAPTTSATQTPSGQSSSAINAFKDLWPKKQRELRPSSEFSQRAINGGSSDMDLLNYWGANKKPTPGMGAFDQMLAPHGGSGLGAVQDIIKSQPTALPKTPPMRLTPSTGRTVSVGANVDVTRAFSLLAQSCQKNQVKRDHARQKFHERPGLKRKRLHSMRWRKRFRQGFKAAVARVQHLRKQGW